MWKRTPEKKNNSSLKELNKYLGKPYALLKGKKKKRHQDNLQKKYKLRKKEKLKVKDEILQKIKAKTLKINQGRLWINRYQKRASEFQQNRFFRNNDG